MKFLVSVLLIAIVGFVAGLYLPWWSIALVAFLVIALIPQKPLYAFMAGFMSIFILWSVMAFMISYKNNHVLVHKVSTLILKINSPLAMVLLTGLIGALVAGFAALAGSYVRKSSREIV